ncbi:hypothetical protein DL95DRAFT_464978 [Leptodontidium sp. 2 PMI_412]|nr:hypothetical protein BKA61DRAFT_30032 [Leptodontidium sp. MPI-SDFR-AT-0119]KAH9211391.1 hypothetical protein DL95DRAFT_464978 [Leptodontidium sp. 2 PMI_412]
MEAPEVQQQRLVVAIDYGTTYTGVAIATPTGNRAYLEEIDVVEDWGPGMGNSKKIPSVISYSLKTQRNEQQWGADLSPQAIAMVHTKLQLDVVEAAAELDLVLQSLDGMYNLDFGYIKSREGKPKYTCKGPEEIVEDYLTHVFTYLLQAVSAFTTELRREIPVDIVATIPAEWGYRAKNSTFRALVEAGFSRDTFPNLREMLLVSEPEAAAIYTARYLKEANGGNFLRQGECFVLCDAGGGTVDVVSYKVKQLEPTFEIEPVTLATGEKCGSIFINLAFKTWLRKLIGPRLYQELDQAQLVDKISSHDAEGERMRALMKKFNVYKRKFEKGHRDIKIDLPEPFENLDLDTRVVGGQITITCDEMESFFEPRATAIVNLIQGQVEQVQRLRTKLRNVFLVGGFAESKYLQSSINESLQMRGLELRIPDTSWTAVVQGAAIFGIEKSTNTASLSVMTACDRSYGIAMFVPFSEVEHHEKDYFLDPLTKTAMAKEQLKWLIKKGDLILSDEPKEVRAGPIDFNFTENSSRRGTIPIYSYDGKDTPDRLAIYESDLTRCHVIHYDLKDIPTQEFRRCKAVGNNPPFYVASLTLIMRVAPGSIHVALCLDQRIVATAVISDTPAETAVQES